MAVQPSNILLGKAVFAFVFAICVCGVLRRVRPQQAQLQFEKQCRGEKTMPDCRVQHFSNVMHLFSNQSYALPPQAHPGARNLLRKLTSKKRRSAPQVQLPELDATPPPAPPPPVIDEEGEPPPEESDTPEVEPDEEAAAMAVESPGTAKPHRVTMSGADWSQGPRLQTMTRALSRAASRAYSRANSTVDGRGEPSGPGAHRVTLGGREILVRLLQ